MGRALVQHNEARRVRDKEADRRRAKEWAAANPEKRKAAKAVYAEVRAGRMPPANAVPCDAEDGTCYGRHHYHHDDYSEGAWLDVRALCSRHHRLWHRDNKAKGAE